MMLMKTKQWKPQKSVSQNENLDLRIRSNCLGETQLEYEINYLEKNKLDKGESKFRKNFIKNSTLILKSQKRFKSKKHNVYTEKVNKIALSVNDDKRIQ